MKTVFTTGEAAKICKVSQQTIIRCFDNGQLRGFRVPGSKFRRIPREALYKFMKDNDIPTDLLCPKRKVLLVETPDAADALGRGLTKDVRFEIRIAVDGFDAGMTAREWGPEVVVIDATLPDLDAAKVCGRLRQGGDDALRIVCIGTAKSEKALKLAGADLHMTKPVTGDALTEAVLTLLELEPAA